MNDYISRTYWSSCNSWGFKVSLCGELARFLGDTFFLGDWLCFEGGLMWMMGDYGASLGNYWWLLDRAGLSFLKN
jgi:hypothetical protein